MRLMATQQTLLVEFDNLPPPPTNDTYTRKLLGHGGGSATAIAAGAPLRASTVSGTMFCLAATSDPTARQGLRPSARPVLGREHRRTIWQGSYGRLLNSCSATARQLAHSLPRVQKSGASSLGLWFCIVPCARPFRGHLHLLTLCPSVSGKAEIQARAAALGRSLPRSPASGAKAQPAKQNGAAAVCRWHVSHRESALRATSDKRSGTMALRPAR